MTPSHRFELILGLMAAVLVIEYVARKVRLPPSAAFVLGGTFLALTPGVPRFEFDPDLTLLLFLPPLLFEGAYFTAWRDFRDNLQIILNLAVGAVVFTTLVIGVVAHLVVPSLPWAACFALGAIISPPDAVAAKSVLQGLPLPPRLTTLLEGESLINDAAGLVLFRFAITAGLTGTFSAGAALGNFLLLGAGGIVAGLGFGYLAARLIRRLRESHLIIVASFLTAWGSYMLGEMLEVSGVLTTVSCGLLMGWRQHQYVAAETRRQALAVWKIAVYLLESLVFVLIGLSLHGVLGRLSAAGLGLSALAPDIGYITVATILSRFLWIFAWVYIPRLLFPALRRRDPYPPVSIPFLMSWTGMRGVVSLAVALAVPEGFPGRDFMLATTLAVIFVSILVQGTTLVPLIRALRVDRLALKSLSLMSAAQARAEIAHSTLDALKGYSANAGDLKTHRRLIEHYTRRAQLTASLLETPEEHAAERAEHYAAVLFANGSARTAVLELHRAGKIHDSILREIEAELDLEEISTRRAMLSAKLN